MLIDRLRGLANSGMIPMHMPGHKRNTELLGTALPYDIDITEITGFDDLHDMRGVLLETANLAAKLYGAPAAFPMVNGSTGGILAAVRACALCVRANKGGSIVMQRFSHRAVYNAAELCSLSPVYITQKRDSSGIASSVDPEAVDLLLQNTPDACCVVITSPTYEGVVSDIAAISKIARSHGVPLIVDAAHGAHFGLSEHFPQNAVRLGADIEIMSLHKTLPALTQCSLALIGADGMVSADALATQLRVFETSSPSYVLLASIDSCLRLIHEDGARLMSDFSVNLHETRRNLTALKQLFLVDFSNCFGYDDSKLVFSTISSNITGATLHSRLRDCGIELEMSAPGFALAMTSLCDTGMSFKILTDALLAIDGELQSSAATPLPYDILPPRIVMPPYMARGLSGGLLPLGEAVGKISLEYVWAYPPGIPLLAPGEIVDEGVLTQIRELKDAGIKPRSDSGAIPLLLCAELC